MKPYTIMPERDTRPELEPRLQRIRWCHPVDLAAALKGYDPAKPDTVVAAHVVLAVRNSEVYLDQELFQPELLIRCARAIKAAAPVCKLVTDLDLGVHPDVIARAASGSKQHAEALVAAIEKIAPLIDLCDVLLICGYCLGAQFLDRDLVCCAATAGMIAARGKEPRLLVWGLWHTNWTQPNTPINDEAIRQIKWFVATTGINPVIFAPNDSVNLLDALEK